MPEHHPAEQWHKLPASVTALILQHLPLKGRLAAASVCQTWAEAAVLATSSIKRKAITSLRLPGLQSWLQQHGQQLTSLQLGLKGAEGNDVLQLPELRQLCRLMLAGCKLQLPAVAHRQRTRSAAHAPAALLPHLTSLQLGGFVLSTPSTLLQLTRVTSLRSLKLGERSGQQSGAIQITPKLHQRPTGLSQALCAVLQHNTQLTQLHVWGLVLEDAALAAVSSLQRLQDCCVNICYSSLTGWPKYTSAGSASSGLLSGLPPSLTSLIVGEGREHYEGDSSHISLPRQLLQLTALKQLELDNARFHPAALSAMTQLQWLQLDDCSLLGDDGGDQSSQGVAAFLAAVGQMQQLEALIVRTCWPQRSLNCPDLPLQSYSALTASTRLQQLNLQIEDAAPLPQGAVQHMFPAGRHPSLLRCVNLRSIDDAVDYMEQPCMTSAELADLIDCCPALHTLRICHVLEETADVTPLLQLPPCCTSLMVGGPAFGDAAAGVVCQLRQLEDLTWHYSEGLTDRGVEQLTALTRLQELKLLKNLEMSYCILNMGNENDDDDDDDVDEGVLHLKGDMEGGPPVWQQLRQLCDQSPLCAPDRLQQVSRELQELQAEVEALRHGNAQLEQQVQGQQQLG